MENKLFAYFDMNPSVAYPVVYGTTYTETFNEEINSMNIMLDAVGSEQYPRLYFDRPYHFVKIVNEIPEGETGLTFNGKNYVILLVDAVNETLNCIGNEKYYRYEIQLMNCVKLLEKIQCPNLVITHSLIEGGNESIWEYIDRYMKLYSPKIKKSTDGVTWDYDYLLDWSLLNVAPFNTTRCADMQMSEPTLRQLLTNLMLQVGCIPTLNYTKISFINYREQQTQTILSDDDGINFISHAIASDSYVNNLVEAPTQALQDENTVISDLVGFRDSDNAVIKQTENLQLEVRYPIYKINQVFLRNTSNSNAFLVPTGQESFKYPMVASTGYFPRFTSYDTGLTRMWEISLNFVYIQQQNVELQSGILQGIKIHLMKYDSVADKYNEIKVIESPILRAWNFSVSSPLASDVGYRFDDFSNTPVEDSSCIILYTGKYSANFRYTSNIFDFETRDSNLLNYVSHVWIEYTFKPNNETQSISGFIPLAAIKQDSQGYYVGIRSVLGLSSGSYTFNQLYPSAETPMTKMVIPANVGKYVEITPLIVENGKRRLLDVDYTTMRNTLFDNLTPEEYANTDLYDLANYIYGTMGYSIGDTKITGMSQTYSRAQMWWTINRTYFDTILEFIEQRQRLIQFDKQEWQQSSEQQIEEYRQQYGMPVYISSNSNVKIEFSTSWANTPKSKFLFDILYQPLNSLKNKISKENHDAEFNIEQLNQSSDGLNDYFRMMLNAQDTANRIGNANQTLPQTIDDVTKIKPLNSVYNDGYYDYTIFNRQFSIYENYLTIKYTASENYVIKNYFTSIITKYRAYQYVDYNQSVVRKDNFKCYCLISDKHWLDGDDHLIFFNQVYTLDDLAEVLNVDVSELGPDSTIINYDDSNTNKINYINSFGLGYPVSISWQNQDWGAIFTGVITTIGFDVDSQIFYDTTNIETFRSAEAFGEGTERFQNTSFAWKATNLFGIGNISSIQISQFVEQEMRLQMTNFLNFIETNYGSQLGNHLDNNQYKLLYKMDGSVLEINGDFYRININYIQNQFEKLELESDFKINKYIFIRNLFAEANDKLQKAIKSNPFSKVAFDSGVNLSSINCARQQIAIYLELLDNYSLSTSYNDFLISGMKLSDDYETIKYIIKRSYNAENNLEEVKNECSLMVNNKGFSLYYQDYDNVSAGPYLTSLEVPGIDTGTGYLQKWQVWNQDLYGKSHEISFAYGLNLKLSSNESTINEYVSQLPIINLGWTYKQFTILQIVDNNKATDFNYTFYKDVAEVINQTIQFEFYSDTKDIEIGKFFVANNRFIGKMPRFTETKEVETTEENYEIRPDSLMWIIPKDGYKMHVNNEMYDIAYDDIQQDGYIFRCNTQNYNSYVEIGYDSIEKFPYIQINWATILSEFEGLGSNVDEIKLAVGRYNTSVDVVYSSVRDLIIFRRNGRTENTKYYLSFNDTKTHKAWYFSNEDDLFETKECKNGISRLVEED